MFGNNDNQQTTMGAPATQSPSMLDNVSAKDFTGTDKPAAQAPAAPAPVPPPQPIQDTLPEHPITTDNPFVQTPASPRSTYTPSPNIGNPTTTAAANVQPGTSDANTVASPETKPAAISTHSSPSIQPSGPVSPPNVTAPPVTATADDDGSSIVDPVVSAVPSVNADKLASMKQEAMEHLEPLVKHLDQKPEEEFKTTMMMIQANDNHTLLDKALASAKNIVDDKDRAQAMLDIINEINYFSQSSSEQ